MEQTIYFRGSRDELRSVLAALPSIAAGRVADPTGEMQRLQLLLGVEALSIIQESFLIKADGGTDEAGLSWAPLKPETIAYSRRHPGLAGPRARAKEECRPGRPLLTEAQDALWRGIFRSRLHQLTGGRSIYKPPCAPPDGQFMTEKARAAALAWMIVKTQGGRTIINEYGKTKVQILRDKGIGFNSLSPGVSGPSGAPGQVFRINPGETIVGTNQKHMIAHHKGNPSKGLPQRRLWAEPKNWPEGWWNRLVGRLQAGVFELATRILR